VDYCDFVYFVFDYGPVAGFNRVLKNLTRFRFETGILFGESF